MFKSTKIIISIATLALVGMFAFYQGAQSSDISSGLFLAAASKNSTVVNPHSNKHHNKTAPGQATKNTTNATSGKTIEED